MFVCNGILFNHESPRRGKTFVTRKITTGISNILNAKSDKLHLGNLNASRDWGHARDYVDAMWRMLQTKKPDDYVIATGKQYSVKQFVNLVLKELKIKFYWNGTGIKSKCYTSKGKIIIECDKQYYRPLEVDTLLGDPRKAKKELNWKPEISINSLVKEMVIEELKKIS
jgi:GDPmannose 4,6-dehydratase